MTAPAIARVPRASLPGGLVAAAWVLAAMLPLVGLVSLLAREMLDPSWANPRVHFVAFLSVGVLASVLALSAEEAARRRGDARVLLLSLAFFATGGFMSVHALGTQSILFTSEHAGFKVAIPVGLLLAAAFAAAAAFVDVRPALAGVVVRHQALLRALVVASILLWTVWTVGRLPPLRVPAAESASGSLLSVMAGVGIVVYGVAAARFWVAFRGRMTLLPASVIACLILLAEAMVGVAVTGERGWHASWWEWHGLIVLAYLIVGFAAWRQWRDERFRPLYLETTRERAREVSVVFGDLAGFTRFAERSTPAEVAAMLSTFYGTVAPLLSRRFGGTVERLTGDGMLVSFNAHAEQPDHAWRAAASALALQREVEQLAQRHAGWPRLRVGVNTGAAVLREMGGDGYVAYELCGDAVNTGARLEGEAPVGGVLIGAETYRRLPDGTAVEARPGLRVKGKDVAVDAFVLSGLPS